MLSRLFQTAKGAFISEATTLNLWLGLEGKIIRSFHFNIVLPKYLTIFSLASLLNLEPGESSFIKIYRYLTLHVISSRSRTYRQQIEQARETSLNSFE
jgi:hypothetical protein